MSGRHARWVIGPARSAVITQTGDDGSRAGVPDCRHATDIHRPRRSCPSPAAGVVGRRPPLSAVAALVAYSRVHTGVHDPSDTIVGAVTGVALAPVGVAALRRWQNRRRSPAAPRDLQRSACAWGDSPRCALPAGAETDVPRTLKRRHAATELNDHANCVSAPRGRLGAGEAAAGDRSPRRARQEKRPWTTSRPSAATCSTSSQRLEPSSLCVPAPGHDRSEVVRTARGGDLLLCHHADHGPATTTSVTAVTTPRTRRRAGVKGRERRSPRGSRPRAARPAPRGDRTRDSARGSRSHRPS